ncbi:MAG TPA: tRNA 2-thiocytidine(32) synthetase TtcA [Steroidobacteraceae bacterium]|nr:tRNA 2-thiocytidine(32) synthetase TtcA [Steroidobacteraceae bacterium]
MAARTGAGAPPGGTPLSVPDGDGSPGAAPAAAPGTPHPPLSRTAQRLQARLRGEVGRAIHDFGMIRDGDRVMVCLSGGKDSYTLLDILLSLQRGAPVDFSLIAVNLDQKQPGFPAEVLPQYLRVLGVPFHIIEQDTYSVVKRVIPQGRTMCGLCSRLRRGALYRFALENGITKIALGHHRDDIVATFFLNLFFGGRLKAMAPKLLSDDGRHVVIRPLAYVREGDIARYASARGFPLIPCSLCGSQENLQRVAVKRMLSAWEREFPGRTQTIFNALRQVEPAHLADPRLHDFAGLERSAGQAAADSAGRAIPAPGSDAVHPMTEVDEERLEALLPALA